MSNQRLFEACDLSVKQMLETMRMLKDRLVFNESMTPAQHADMIDRISQAMLVDAKSQNQTIAVKCSHGNGARIWRAICQHMTNDRPRIGARVVDVDRWNARIEEVKP